MILVKNTPTIFNATAPRYGLICACRVSIVKSLLLNWIKNMRTICDNMQHHVCVLFWLLMASILHLHHSKGEKHRISASSSQVSPTSDHWAVEYSWSLVVDKSVFVWMDIFYLKRDETVRNFHFHCSGRPERLLTSLCEPLLASKLQDSPEKLLLITVCVCVLQLLTSAV